MTTTNGFVRGFLALSASTVLLLAGCSSGTPVQETTYVASPYADPVVVNGWVEPTSMLPYGGGNEGIRTAEDEALPPTSNMGYY